MKQKIVVEVCARCDKCRKEAMEIAGGARGVISVKLPESETHKLEVEGKDVDPVGLCKALRKKLGHAKLISVEEVKPPKSDGKSTKTKSEEEETKKGKKDTATVIHHCPPNCLLHCTPPNCCCPTNQPRYYLVKTVDDDISICNIM